MTVKHRTSQTAVSTGPTSLLHTTSGKGHQPKGVLTAGAAPSRKAPAKRRRPRAGERQRREPRIAKAADPAVSPQGTEGAGATATPLAKIYLRPFTPEDEPIIVKMTQDEIMPVFKETYGYDLDMATVMNYVRSAQTRLIVVEEQAAGYISLVADDGGKMNIGSLVLGSGYQGRGYGTRVMKQIEREAVEYGMVEMEVYIQAANKRSQKFARALGFTEIQSFQPQTVVMTKSLVQQTATVQQSATVQ